jgi:acyl-CoA thioester hydrolase
MMGHAYYGNYLLWFEQARGAWCRARGFTYKSLEEAGYKLPVVEVWARYRGEVKYDDDIVVRIRLDEIKRAAMKFHYDVFNETTQTVTTEGYTWHVLIDHTHKAVTVPEIWKSKLLGPPISGNS